MRTQHSIPPPAFKFSPTPEVPTCKSDATKLTNQICPSWSSDTFITPPQLPPESSPSVVTADTKPHPSKLPLKSALRRSERLRKTSLVVSQRKVGISNLVHVSVFVCVCAHVCVHVYVHVCRCVTFESIILLVSLKDCFLAKVFVST